RASTADVAQFLEEVLGGKLVAFIAGVSDPRTVTRWAKGERKPRPDNEARLRHAAQVFRLLNTDESPHAVRPWLVGLNPQLDDESPAVAIREDRFRETSVAAKAFLAGG